MQIKKRFRFMMDVEAVIDVNGGRENDDGINRYFNLFFNQLVKDQEALRNFLLNNLIERFLEHSQDDLKNFLDNSGKYGNDAIYILSAASKCEHEVSNYFKIAFAPFLNQDVSIGLDEVESNDELDTTRTIILEKLVEHLKKLEPINIDCYELSPGPIQLDNMNEQAMVK